MSDYRETEDGYVYEPVLTKGPNGIYTWIGMVVFCVAFMAVMMFSLGRWVPIDHNMQTDPIAASKLSNEELEQMKKDAESGDAVEKVPRGMMRP